MTKKIVIMFATVFIILFTSNIVYADNTELQSEIYKIAEYKGKNYIQGITPETVMKEINENLNSSKEKTYHFENGSMMASGTKAKTGMYVQIEDEKYYFVVGLDINKDGNVSTTDMLKMCLYIVGSGELEDIELLAGDTNIDGDVTGTDVLRSKMVLIDIIEKSDLYFDKGENSDFEYGMNLATKKFEISKVKATSKEKLVIPEQIEGKAVNSIGDNIFSQNGTITEIEIPKTIANIKTGAFANCTELEKIVVDSGNETFTSQDGVLFNKDKTELIFYPTGIYAGSYEVPESVITIKSKAFSNVIHLEEIHIGENVKAIEKDAINNWKGTIYGTEGSVAIQYAMNNSIKYEIPEIHEDGIEVENTGVYVIPPVDPKRTQIKGRYNPENNVGIDIGGDQGEKVVAVMSGYVGKVDEKKGSVVITSKNHLVQIFFIHMDNIRVKEGTNVKQGEQVGEIGRHGLASEAYSRVDYGLSVLVDGAYEHRNPTPYTGH